MSIKNDNTCNEGPCTIKKPFSRENYYFGKLLTAEALKSEQNYLNEKRWIINRYGIGWGVLCGLEVVPDANDPCKVSVLPGMAIDKNGNEIIVCEPNSIDLKKILQKEQEKGGGEICNSDEKIIYITIRYKEVQKNPSPIPVDDCCEIDEKYNYNRCEEVFHIDGSLTEPQKPKSIREECMEVLGCENNTISILDNPAIAIINKCEPREQGREITLACIRYREDKKIEEHQIDNSSYRKLAFSNEMLYALIQVQAEKIQGLNGEIQHLIEEIRFAKGAHYDRRRHVPLLANTIKGLTYQNGKNFYFDNVGKHAHRMTSDGDTLWITDCASPKLIRINQKGRQSLEIDCSEGESSSFSWGIAFDGQHMWVSHNNTGSRKLSRINVCNIKETNTYGSPIPDNPQELFYHQNRLFISHAKENNHCLELHVSIIDTKKCSLRQIIEINAGEYTPVSGICSMAFDGKALWIAYQVKRNVTSNTKEKNSEKSIYLQCIEINDESDKPRKWEVSASMLIPVGNKPEKLAYDGSHLWVSHDQGVSKIDCLNKKLIPHSSRTNKYTGLAYGGGHYLWAATIGNNEAFLDRIDIHNGACSAQIEYINDIKTECCCSDQHLDYEVTDTQFDGTYIYIAGRVKDKNGAVKGIIHRVLP